MKTTVYLLCEECDNIFLTSNLIADEKTLVCGQGCGGELKSISKNDACKFFQEKSEK
jgi:hypothetical protein